MYHTGLRFGLNDQDGFDTRYDPAAAARANVAYLSEQFRYLNNNLEMALAAYNGGEGRMRRLAQSSRSKNYWSGEIQGQFPRETQEYVPYVLAAAWLFLHPDDYGLEFPRVDASPGQVQLAKAMTLSELTVCLGQAGSRDGWFRTLRNLNPRVDPNKRLPAGSSVAMPATLAVVYRQPVRRRPHGGTRHAAAGRAPARWRGQRRRQALRGEAGRYAGEHRAQAGLRQPAGAGARQQDRRAALHDQTRAGTDAAGLQRLKQ